MNGPEIQKKIAENMRIIEDEASHGMFTLSARANSALEEINIFVVFVRIIMMKQDIVYSVTKRWINDYIIQYWLSAL